MTVREIVGEARDMSGNQKKPRELARLWEFTSPSLGRILIALALGICSAILVLIQPKLVGTLIGSAIDANVRGTDLLMLVVMVIGGSVFAAISAYLLATVSEQTAFRIRRRFVSELLRFPLPWFARHPSGDLMSRGTNDVNAVKQAISIAIVGIATSLVTLVGAITALLLIDRSLFLVVISILIAAGLIVSFASRSISANNQLAQAAVGQFGAGLVGAITGIRIIKAYSQVEREETLLETRAAAVQKRNLSVSRVQSFLTPLSETISQGALIAVVLIGGVKVMNSQLTFADITEFVLYLNLLVPPFNSIVGQIIGLKIAHGAMVRVSEVTDSGQTESDVVQSSNLVAEAVRLEPLHEDTVVALESVSYTYPGSEVPAISKISVKVRKGDRIAIVGASGAGKSTLFALILGLLTPDNGTVSVRLSTREHHPHALAAKRNRIGYVDQRSHLISGTIRENLTFGDESISDRQILSTLEQMGLLSRVMETPSGLDTHIGEAEAVLSGGEAQKIAVARALLWSPEVLLFDEPASSLDLESERALMEVFEAIPIDVTTLIISHRSSTLQGCNRIIRLEKGQLVSDQAHKTLLDAGLRPGRINGI